MLPCYKPCRPRSKPPFVMDGLPWCLAWTTFKQGESSAWRTAEGQVNVFLCCISEKNHQARIYAGSDRSCRQQHENPGHSSQHVHTLCAGDRRCTRTCPGTNKGVARNSAAATVLPQAVPSASGILSFHTGTSVPSLRTHGGRFFFGSQDLFQGKICEMECTPKLSGRYSFCARMMGMQCPGSPISIRVQVPLAHRFSADKCSKASIHLEDEEQPDCMLPWWPGLRCHRRNPQQRRPVQCKVQSWWSEWFSWRRDGRCRVYSWSRRRAKSQIRRSKHDEI